MRLGLSFVCLPVTVSTSSSVVGVELGVVIERWGTGERRRGGPRVDSLTLLVPLVILLVSVPVFAVPLVGVYTT